MAQISISSAAKLSNLCISSFTLLLRQIRIISALLMHSQTAIDGVKLTSRFHLERVTVAATIDTVRPSLDGANHIVVELGRVRPSLSRLDSVSAFVHRCILRRKLRHRHANGVAPTLQCVFSHLLGHLVEFRDAPVELRLFVGRIDVLKGLLASYASAVSFSAMTPGNYPVLRAKR